MVVLIKRHIKKKIYNFGLKNFDIHSFMCTHEVVDCGKNLYYRKNTTFNPFFISDLLFNFFIWMINDKNKHTYLKFSNSQRKLQNKLKSLFENERNQIIDRKTATKTT